MSSFSDSIKTMRNKPSAEDRKSLLSRAKGEIETDIRSFFSSVADAVGDAAEDVKEALGIESDIKGEKRYTWKNATKNQIVQPLQYFRPDSLQDLKEIILNAESKGLKVRAIGSGHSFSDVNATTDFMIDTHGLKGIRDIDPNLLNPGAEPATLFETECGITIRDLNNELDYRGLALANMGGYDAQTIIGATSTSTHGSGITLGPLSDSIVSIVVISDGGAIYRIEPADGVTNPAAYKAKYPNSTLVQDNDWFNSVIVGMGAMGVVYSVMLRVVPKYWLKEVRTLSTWEQVKSMLRDGSVLRDHRHWEVLVNPYKTDVKDYGDDVNLCLITTRDPVPEPGDLPFDKEHRNVLTEITAAIPGIENVFELVFNTFPELTPSILNESLKSLVDDQYTNISYKVLNIGSANDISAYSSEIGYPMSSNRYLDAVDRIIELAGQSAEIGEVYHTVPISLRFVKASRAYLSMQAGYDTCMIEMPFVEGSHGAFEVLRALEREMFAFSGRPHWGQLNYFSGNHGFIGDMYPQYAAWQRVYGELNKNGTFDNVFTDRMGFSRNRFVAPNA